MQTSLKCKWNAGSHKSQKLLSCLEHKIIDVINWCSINNVNIAGNASAGDVIWAGLHLLWSIKNLIFFELKANWRPSPYENRRLIAGMTINKLKLTIISSRFAEELITTFPPYSFKESIPHQCMFLCRKVYGCV